MSISSLASLDRQIVSVECWIEQELRLFSGLATYELDPDLGPVLSIQVTEPEGEFHLLLDENCRHDLLREACGQSGYRLRLSSPHA